MEMFFIVTFLQLQKSFLEDEIKYLSRDMYRLAVKHRVIVLRWNAHKSISKVIAHAISSQVI